MNKICILSDFDGTITTKDGLYTFIENYAKGDWETIERNWAEGKINSQDCLIEEFKLIPNLSESLISDFIQKKLDIDKYFTDFFNYIKQKNIDFFIVSDGIDYFINKILNKYYIQGISIIANHGEFINNEFKITFPNKSDFCVNNSGTCKCKVLNNLRQKYEKIIYIGDGVSDYCVCDKADILFAKSRLASFCKQKKINYIKYNNFNEILKHISLL